MPVPADPREVEAALHASAVVWRAFPYFGFRYGERGKRFAHSDSAYFVTLADHPQPLVDRQIDWTASLLAARGMPSWLLEVQLRVLYRVFKRRLGVRGRLTSLLRAADGLAARRRAAIPEARFLALGERFAARAGYPGRRFARGTGQLIAAAVADEWNGLPSAVESLTSWLCDPTRFTRGWIVAAEDTIAAARAACLPKEAPLPPPKRKARR